MPEMDGIEMAAEIKLIQADARFIVMTAENNVVTARCRHHVVCHCFSVPNLPRTDPSVLAPA
jgi:CheY-like chemotaxis protein